MQNSLKYVSYKKWKQIREEKHKWKINKSSRWYLFSICFLFYKKNQQIKYIYPYELIVNLTPHFDVYTFDIETG